MPADGRNRHVTSGRGDIEDFKKPMTSMITPKSYPVRRPALPCCYPFFGREGERCGLRREPTYRVQAHMWFNIAASRFITGETHREYSTYRDQVAEKMTPNQIAEAQKLAREWKQIEE